MAGGVISHRGRIAWITRRVLPAAAAAAAAVALGSMVSPQPALAQSSVRSGTIANVFVSAGTYYAFRVVLTQNGTYPLANCSSGFAYVNTSNDNYQTYVAELTTAYIRGTPVTLTIAPDANGFCQILEFGA